MPLPRTLLALLTLLLTLLLAPPLVAGCALAPSGEEKGRAMAEDRIHAEADALAQDLRSVAWLGRARYLAAQVPADADDGWPGGHDWDVTRQLLVSEQVDGSGGAGGRPGFALVVRIRVHVVPGTSGEWSPPEEATVTRCFSFTVYDGREVTPEQTDCPGVDPIPVDRDVRVPSRPAVHERDRRSVEHFLAHGGTVADLELLQGRLSRGFTATAAMDDGVTGVAVTARPDGTDCVLGRRDRRGRVSVWHPPRIQTVPGEIGCVPALAIHPLPPPH